MSSSFNHVMKTSDDEFSNVIKNKNLNKYYKIRYKL